MRLPSGLKIDDRIGINGDLEVTEGYDNGLPQYVVRPDWMDDEDWSEAEKMSKDDKIALGKIMVERWSKFLKQAESE